MNSTIRNRIVRALSPTRLSARVLAAIAFAGVITSAFDVHGISEPGTLASINVTPNATLAAASTQQMLAVGYDADGRVVTIAPVWSVVASGGTINTSGMFSAGNVTGLFANTVVASVGAISGRASIIVTAGALASITVVPTPVTLAVTGTQQFVAIGRDAGGNIVQFTPTWSVVADGGTIDGNGIFTAGALPGTYTNTVQASNGGMKAFATVTVTAGPLASLTITPNPATLFVTAQQQFVAVGRDVLGNNIPIAAVWSVVNGGGTVDGAGLFTAGGTPGTFTNTIKATSGSLTANATVIVTVGPLATITVTPNPANMAINSAQQMTAVGRDIAGNVIAITPTWAVVTLSNGASITQTGIYTSGTVAGTFANKVRASSGAISGFATIVVTAGPVVSILVTPNPVAMLTVSTQQFIATGMDAGGNTFLLTPVWSVVNGGGSINNTGLFTSGFIANTFLNTIQATSGVISGYATVTVNAPAPPPPGPSPLGTAANYGIISGASIRCGTPGTPGGISGLSSPANIGSGNSTYTGFPPGGPCTLDGIIPAVGVNGTAMGDLVTAYLAAQAIVGCTVLTGLDLGSIALNPLPPGTYCFTGSAQLTGTLHLTGSAAGVWTFQIATTLTTAAGSSVILAGGAIADHVYWAVGSSATLGTNSDFSGNIMALAAITLNAGATLHGRALAQTAGVDMIQGGSFIIKP